MNIVIKDCCVMYDETTTILILEVIFKVFFNKTYEITIILPENTKIQFMKNDIYIEDELLTINLSPYGSVSIDVNTIQAYGIKFPYSGIVGFDSDSNATFFLDSNKKCVVEIRNWTEI